MSDFVASFGLSDAEFQRGLARVQAEGIRTSRALERGWGGATRGLSRMGQGFVTFLSGQRLLGAASRAMAEYGRELDLNAARMDRLSDAQERFGRVLGTSAGSTADLWGDALDRVTAAWLAFNRAIYNTGAAIAREFSGGPRRPTFDEIGALEDAERRQKTSDSVERLFEDERRQQRWERMRLDGDAEGAQAEREIHRIRQLGLGPDQTQQLIDEENALAATRRVQRSGGSRHGRGLTLGSGVGADVARGFLPGGMVRPEFQTIREQVKIAKEQERKLERVAQLLQKIESNTAKGSTFGP